MADPAEQSEYTRHRPVMLAEVLEVLQPHDDGLYVDGTFGAGGYTCAVLDAARCTVYGIDRDPEAISAAHGLMERFSGRLHLVQGRFADVEALLAPYRVLAVDGLVLDVGVSSMQLDQAERGFSFHRDGPLDMRMEKHGMTAAQAVNGLSEGQLKRIFAVFGEERRAGAVARSIVAARDVKPLTSSVELANLVERVLGPMKPGGRKIHPATRVFQALRVYVNDELGQLARALSAAERLLKPGGRLAVVCFHSLEDRIVKRFFKRRCGGTSRPSRHVPDPGPAPDASFKDILKGGRTPGPAELDANPRARSARLRAVERTEADALPIHAAHDGLFLGAKDVAPWDGAPC